MHYTKAAIVDAAVDQGDRWTKAVITLEEGDTAESLHPEFDFAGQGEIEYFMHPRLSSPRPGEGIHHVPKQEA